MIRIEQYYLNTETVNGISYFHITYEMFDLKEFADSFTGGLVGKILDAIDLLLPSPSICAYIPATIPEGSTLQYGPSLFPVWQVPDNLYLLGANVEAGSRTMGLTNLLLFRVLATYTIYAPDADGVTFIPDFNPTQPNYEPFITLPGGYGLIAPAGGNSETYLAPVTSRYSYSGAKWHNCSTKLLFLWSGAIPNSYHFLYNDNLIQMTQRYGGMFCEIGVIGKIFQIREDLGLINDATWNFPQPYEWEETNTGQSLSVPLLVCPSNTPIKLVYPGVMTPSDNKFLPFLGDKLFKFPFHEEKSMLAPFQVFIVDGTPFSVGGSPLEVRE